MIRPRLRAPRIGLLRPSFRRSIHVLPMLRPHHDYRNGIPDLYSQGGFEMAWTDYMTLILGKLNAAVAGTEYEKKDLKAVLTATAREPSLAHIFNYASMAHNTHFFFEKIAPEPVPMPTHLKAHLEQDFSSIETLRREFIMTANAMFGPGFVWLVKAPQLAVPGASTSSAAAAAARQTPSFRILTTYLAGSPYPGAHWRRQAVDMNSVGGQSPEAGEAARSYFATAAASGAMSSSPGPGPAHMEKRPPGGVEVVPLLCLNTWEHSWLFDYGLGATGYGGKQLFAEKWWDRIDWEAVASAANILKAPSFKK